MLENEIVLVRRSADAPEDITLHKMIHIAPETVNDLRSHRGISIAAQDRGMGLTCHRADSTHVVIVPNIQLRDLPVRYGEGRRVEPPNVILEVIRVARLP